MINRIILIGRLANDPIFKQSAEGIVNLQFTVAVPNGEHVDYIPCVSFGKLAEWMNNRNMKKGEYIAIEGHMQSGKYEKNGDIKYTLNCVIEKFVDPSTKQQSDTVQGEEF